MNVTTTYKSVLTVIAICLCTLFCGYVILKNYHKSVQIVVSQSDEKNAEQKEEVKETVGNIFPIDFPRLLLTAHTETSSFNLVDEKLGHYHFISPETPPPNQLV